MSHSVELSELGPVEKPLVLRPVNGSWLDWLLYGVNRAVAVVSMIALSISALVLTYSVVVRYLLKVPTDWQDEVAVFLLVGATFLCGAMVQAHRGHVGIQVLEAILSPAVNRVRLLLCDFLSGAFCGFFSWKSWSLCREAIHEGQTTSSTWGPPLWIPYSLMAAGMTLLTLQYLAQILAWFRTPPTPAKSA